MFISLRRKIITLEFSSSSYCVLRIKRSDVPQATEFYCFVCLEDLTLHMHTADERSVKYGSETQRFSWHESRIPVHKYLQVR